MRKKGRFERAQAGRASAPGGILIALSLAATLCLLSWMLFLPRTPERLPQTRSVPYEKLDLFLRSALSVTPDGEPSAEPTRPVYTLNDGDTVAPKPDPACYGTVRDPSQMEPILHQAEALLDGQRTLFSTDLELREGSEITYYLDETIFAVTWKQVLDNCVYTFSEVKVAHPSQFRRFLADNRYGSGVQYTTTEMSKTVNAVVASSGDYYGYRSIGIVVDKGVVYRDRGHYLDTCYIDENGDLLFTYAGEITDQETAQKFVDEHRVRFSVSFGPVMVLDGEYRVPDDYNSGEINKGYARAALCQMDKLHYVVVAANLEDPYFAVPKVSEFGRRLQELGIPTAYALDGGQTAAIAMNDCLINRVSYGAQREISDIIYFATALPEKSEVGP